MSKLRLLGTSVHFDGSEKGLRYGQVLWGRESGSEMVGLAWDWREVMEDVIVLADPMAVLTNLDLVDEAGEKVSQSERILQLNRTIYRTPWQEGICDTRRRWMEALAA